jgi:DNA-binding transcriptional regulator YhcF (GntR family)
MKMLLLIVGIVLVLLTAVYGFFGGFHKVKIQTISTGGEILVYENVTGAYNQAVKITNKVYYELLNQYGIETKKGFGIFYDNPKNVEQNKLRSEIGCVVEDIDKNTLDRVKANFQVKILSRENCLVAEFPFRGFPSIIMGMIKVYPIIGKYIIENNYEDGPIMEIYDSFVNKKIIYRKFLNKI